MFVYVCMCVYVCVGMCVYVCVCVCIYMRVCVYSPSCLSLSRRECRDCPHGPQVLRPLPRAQAERKPPRPLRNSPLLRRGTKGYASAKRKRNCTELNCCAQAQRPLYCIDTDTDIDIDIGVGVNPLKCFARAQRPLYYTDIDIDIDRYV